MRVVHIEREPQSQADEPTYCIFDTGRYGEEFGAADVLNSLRPQQVGDWLAREGATYSRIEQVLAKLRQTGSDEVELAPRIGPRILRAWFDTVINPVVHSLESELFLLARLNWTFSFRLGKLELIRPLRDYVAPEHAANIEQVLQSELSLAANAAAHDDSVERLRATVSLGHKLLVESPDFTTLCDSLLAAEKLHELGVSSVMEIFGAYPPSDRYGLIAQYVINSTGEQAPHYSTAKLWNKDREVLVQTLKLPGIREQHASAVELSEHLKAVTRGLVGQLKTLREQLSLRYDVPLVTNGR